MTAAEIVVAVLGSSAISSVLTYGFTRPKMLSEAELNDAMAGEKTVQMALAFAKAADQKAKDIDAMLQKFKIDFEELQSKFTALTREHICLVKYVEKCRQVIASFNPNHPILTTGYAASE